MADITQQIKQQVETARSEKKSLNIIGGNSKSFYGRESQGQPLNLAQHCGIINYEPTELVLTARAGTTLEEIENALNKNQQMLPFEPPYFGPNATIGGTIACNFSGPRRAYAGAARDFVLGTTLINGKAEVLHFGGEVMKNVAGYDVSRLMAGAMGTLGVLLDVSLKVLPKPAHEITLVQEIKQHEAISFINKLAAQPVPLSASCYHDGKLYYRLSGTVTSLNTARTRLGGAILPDGNIFWRNLREQQLPFFQSSLPLWRVSVPQTTLPINIAGEWLMEWGGALRWLSSDAPASEIREAIQKLGGHIVLFRGVDSQRDGFHPLDTGLAKIHQHLKRAFDPDNIFNIGRMYPNL